MKKERGPIVHVPITAELKRKLSKRAAQEERSLSQVVRRALDAYLSAPVPR